MPPRFIACLPLAALALSGQSLPGPAMPDQVPPSGETPKAKIHNLHELESARCADVVRLVRDAGGQPPLERGPATGEDGYLIAAVDKRVGGCAVMQMHGDVNDLRPLPRTSEDFRLRPADR